MSRVYVADFETNNFEHDCRVWAWGVARVGDPLSFKFGNHLDTFMEWCSKQGRGNTTIFFHNLGFDIVFIFDWLFRNGFEYSERSDPNTFQATITGTGDVLSASIVYKKQQKNLQRVTFLNSYKKIPLKVADIAKVFKMPYQKLSIDYEKFREFGYKMSQEEEDYLRHDIMIVCKSLERNVEQKLLNLTAANDALMDYKRMIGKDVFELHFPVLDIETHKDIAQGYKGGFVYVNPKFEGKLLGNGTIYDVNSLYPYIMKVHKLPYGTPHFFEGQYQEDLVYPLFLQHFSCCFRLKENHLPFARSYNFYNSDTIEYLSESLYEPEHLYLTNVEMELFFEHYEVFEVEFHNGYKFKASNQLFSDYVDKWQHVKVNSEDEGERQLAKLMQNALYGKFAQRTEFTSSYPELDEEEIVQYRLNEGKKEKDPIYIPVSLFVASYARWYTIRTAQANIKNYIYSDTDSVHLLGSETDGRFLLVDEKKLGYWKIEHEFEQAKYIQPKLYAFEENGELIVKGAGMTEEVKNQVTLDNFHRGTTYEGRLMPKRVKGGVVLVKDTYTIN